MTIAQDLERDEEEEELKKRRRGNMRRQNDANNNNDNDNVDASARGLGADCLTKIERLIAELARRIPDLAIPGDLR